jgi:hypothetical protein
MLIGEMLIPFGLVASMSLAFLILSKLRHFYVIFVTGALMAIVPILINYLIHGASNTTVLISSVATAAIGVIPTAVAEIVKTSSSKKAA